MKIIFTIVILAVIVASFAFAGSLPTDVFSIRATGAYRKMTTYDNNNNSANTLLGLGFAFDYDTYFNNYAGLYVSAGVTIPVKSTTGDTKLSISDSDVPAYSNFGFVGRIPVSNHFGLDFKLGFGVAYDKTVKYRYYWWYDYIEYSKVEYQMTASLESYYFFDSEGEFGVKLGVSASYTFATSLVVDSSYSNRKRELEDMKITGYEILPYVAVVFGF